MTNSFSGESLNVLLLAEDFYPKESGGAFIDWNVATFLVENGDSVTTVTPRNAEAPRKETVDGVEIRRPFQGHQSDSHPNSIQGFLRRIVFSLVLVPYLLVICWRQEFDLIYSTNHLLHPPAVIASFINGLFHVSFIGYSPSIREEEASLLNPLVALERVNFQMFLGDLAICQTPSIEQILSRDYNQNVERTDGTVDTEAIYEAVNSPRKHNIETNSNSHIELIFVGRLVSIKNPAELPNIISELPSEYRLTIVGDGPCKSDIEEAVEELNIKSRVTLMGKLPHKKTLRLIHSSNVLLLPSAADAYPTVVFEALCLDTPVLATPVGALPSMDHPKLMLSELDAFAATIPIVNHSASHSIDENAMERFSVTQLAKDVRVHMLELKSERE